MTTPTKMDPSKMSEAMKFALLPPDKQRRILDQLSEDQLKSLPYDWNWWGRPQQLRTITDFMDDRQPDGHARWSYCMALSGRGWGKTKTGAEWVRHLIEDRGYMRGAIVAPTAGDARDLLVEGESGILSVCPPWNFPLYEPAKRRLTWPNGAICTIYSADEPKRLRGQNSEFAWCDELASWERGEDSWNMLILGLRIGPSPKALITTTPLPIKLIMDLAADDNTLILEGSTYENRVNLSRVFFDKVIGKFEGTDIGEQEIHGKILQNLGGMFKPDYIQTKPFDELPELQRVVVAVDPATKSTNKNDDTGIAVCAKGRDGNYYLLYVEGIKATPKEWADRVYSLYQEYMADRIIAEDNNGGEMVEHTLMQGHSYLPVQRIHASRGKLIRAEPISLLYQKGRVYHVTYPTGKGLTREERLINGEKNKSIFEAQKQMYSFRNNPNEANDKVDAIVYGFSELAADELMPFEVPAVAAVPSNYQGMLRFL